MVWTVRVWPSVLVLCWPGSSVEVRADGCFICEEDLSTLIGRPLSDLRIRLTPPLLNPLRILLISTVQRFLGRHSERSQPESTDQYRVTMKR
jgi:hypothetical protein